jgi:hypothetical protein
MGMQRRIAVSDVSDRRSIEAVVRQALQSTDVIDIHTHLYAPEFGGLLLWGIEEMLTFHYIVAEFFRLAGSEIDHEQFWKLSKARQAALVWDHLFVRRSPISESCRGVITCLQGLGLDASSRDLATYQRYFAETNVRAHLDRVLDLTNVRTMVMTNDPFDEAERLLWTSDLRYDERFRAALRIDTLLVGWDRACGELRDQGYDVRPDLSGPTRDEVRRFLSGWIARMRPVYLAASLPPSFRYPDDAASARLLKDCVLPVAAEHGLAMGMMIGVRRGVNPRLRLAGDAVGKADLTSLANLCAAFSKNRFLITVLGREDQHELAVTARKFHNLHVFGCWWFVNVPSLTEEITRLRVELLGHSFTPQHSDARVLEQLIYKWHDAKVMLTDVLTDKYARLALAGYALTDDQIRAEVADLMGGSAIRFLERG